MVADFKEINYNQVMVKGLEWILNCKKNNVAC